MSNITTTSSMVLNITTAFMSNSTTTSMDNLINDSMLRVTTTSTPNPFGGESGEEAVDALWVIMATFIIFTMQSGFGLLESGNNFIDAFG